METEEISKKNNNKVIIIVSVLVIALVVALVYVFNFYKKPSIKLISKELTIEQGDSVDLLSNLALENVDSDKIKFNISPNNMGTFDGSTFKSVNPGSVDAEVIYEDIKLSYKIIIREKTKEENSTNEEYIVSFYDGENLFDSVKVKNRQILIGEGYLPSNEYFEEFFYYGNKKPQKDGYMFAGWSKEGETTVYHNFIIDNDLKLFANFVKVHKLNIIYDENYTRIFYSKEEDMKKLYEILYEGTYSLKPCSYTYENGQSICHSLKEGYSFDGWYLDGNKITKDTKINGDNLTIVAKYTKDNDTSYLEEYKKFETDNLSADLIYELNKKTFVPTMGGKYKSEYYYRNLGKTEEYSLEDKVSNVIDIISKKINCGSQDITIDNQTGCYISPESIEKTYKYIYGNDSYFEHKINDKFEGWHGNGIDYSFSSTENYYFNPVYHMGIGRQSAIEKIVDVVKYDDRIELTKKAISCGMANSNEEGICYDFDEILKAAENQIPLESTEFEEVKDKLDAYIFVFKKDSKDNYYLYEVKKEEAK